MVNKLTVVGDPHAKPNNLDQIRELFALIEELGNTTVILGDLLDTKEVIRGKCLNTYIELFNKSSLDFIVLVGNHDWFNLDCKEHALEAFKTLPNVKVIEELTELHGCYFAPYMTTIPGGGVGNLKGIPFFGHLDIPGFDYGHGHISDHGICKSQFKKFPITISGHYHKYQEFKKDENGHIVYLGTPFSHSFGESNQKKYLGVFDLKTHELELVETHFPKHVTLELGANEDWEERLKEYDTSKDHLRIVLDGSKEALLTVDTTPYPEVKFILKPEKQVASTKTLVTQNPTDQFRSWAKTRGNLSKEVIDIGIEVLNKCLRK